MTSPDTYAAFMLDHTAGNLTPAMNLAASIHRLMSSEGDEAATLWESVRKALVSEGDHRTENHETEPHVTTALNIIHTDYSDVNWRRGLSGVHYAKSPIKNGQLMRLKPGQSVFSHGHSRLEATVVLEGTLDDGLGVYEVGDILLAEPGLQHKPSAGGNQSCTCFVARSPKPFWRLT